MVTPQSPVVYVVLISELLTPYYPKSVYLSISIHDMYMYLPIVYAEAFYKSAFKLTFTYTIDFNSMSGQYLYFTQITNVGLYNGIFPWFIINLIL